MRTSQRPAQACPHLRLVAKQLQARAQTAGTFGMAARQLCPEVADKPHKSCKGSSQRRVQRLRVRSAGGGPSVAADSKACFPSMMVQYGRPAKLRLPAHTWESLLRTRQQLSSVRCQVCWKGAWRRGADRAPRSVLLQQISRPRLFAYSKIRTSPTSPRPVTAVLTDLQRL